METEIMETENINNDIPSDAQTEATPGTDFSQLQKELEEARRRIKEKEDYARKIQSESDRKIMEHEKKLAELQQAQNAQKAMQEMPKSDNYDDIDKYLSDKVKWDLDNTVKIKDVVREVINESNQQNQLNVLFNKFKKNEAILKSNENYNDYDTVTSSSYLQNILEKSQNGLAQSLMALDDGAKIIYYMGKNWDVAQKLGNLPPHQLTAELVNIVSGIKKAEKAPKTAENPPINPVKGGAGSGISEKPKTRADMSKDEWVADVVKRMMGKGK